MQPKTVLFLSSNQPGRTWLNIDREVHRVSHAIEESPHRTQLHFRNRPAVQVTDLGPAVDLDRPTVVHFSGHGHRGGRPVLFDQNGLPKDVDPTIFASVFTKSSVELVILNACFSRPLAQLLVSQGVRFVAGVEAKVPDEASLAFSEVLYRNLARGSSLENAFQQAVTASKLQIFGSHRYQLVSAPNADANQWKLIQPPSIRDDQPPLQLLLILDVFGDGGLAEVRARLPDRRQDRVEFRLSDGLGLGVHSGNDRGNIDWRALGNAVEDLAVRMRQRLATNPHPMDCYVCGEAPLPVFAHLGSLLSGWTERITSFSNARRGTLLELPLSAAPRSTPLLTRRGLEHVSPANGRVAVYVSAERAPDPNIEAKVRAHLQERGEPLAGVVQLTTTEELDRYNIGNCTQELGQALSQLSSVYPQAQGVDLFLAGPETLALCAGRAVPSNLIDLTLPSYLLTEYVPALVLPWRRGRGAPPSMDDAAQLERRKLLVDLTDTLTAFREKLEVKHIRIPVGLRRTSEEETQLAESLIRHLRRLQVEREPSDGLFHLDARKGQLRFGHTFLEALRPTSREVRARFIRLFLLHELYHYDQNVNSSNYRRAGQAALVLEEVDYWADAFALLTCVHWEIERGGAAAAEKCSTRLVENIEAHLDALALFDRMEYGDMLLDLPVRRLRRSLIWYLQWARAQTITQPEHVTELLGSRLFVEMAPLDVRGEPRQLLVATNGRMSRNFRSPDNFEPVALLRAVREGDRTAIGRAMDHVVAENAAFLTPWAK
jgi:hypothetical protein